MIHQNDLLNLLDLIYYIINDKNVSDINFSKSLDDPIDLTKLQQKFNK